MPLFTSYDAVGLKEDVSDIITNISPTKTPFQSMIGREKISQKFFQWQEDSLRAAAVNAQLEGFDANFVTVNPTVMRTNITQILAEASQVSGTMDVTSVYGRARESAYQLAKSAAQVKRDLEVALVGTISASVTGNDATARRMAPYCQQMVISGLTGSQQHPDWYSYQPGGAATGFVLSETAMLSALQACYNNGAEPNTVMVTPTNALNVAIMAKAGGLAANTGGYAPPGAAGTKIDTDVGNRYRFLQDNNDGSGPRNIVNAVDVYASPFGKVNVVINRFVNGSPLAAGSANSHTLVFNPSMWVLCTLRPWFREVLAKTGDSIKQMIVGEFSLKHKNWLASALVIDQSNAAQGSGTF
jgi:Family of unknown function (DUF5309)